MTLKISILSISLKFNQKNSRQFDLRIDQSTIARIRRGQADPWVQMRNLRENLLDRIRASFSEIAPIQTRSGFVCEYSASEYNVQTSMPDPFPDADPEED